MCHILAWKAASQPWLVTHVYREANQALDWLASKALSGPFTFTKDTSLPLDFQHILQADAYRTLYNRSVSLLFIFQLLLIYMLLHL